MLPQDPGQKTGRVLYLRKCLSLPLQAGIHTLLLPYLKDKDPPHSSRRRSEEHRNLSSCYCSANIPAWSLFHQPKAIIFKDQPVLLSQKNL